MQYRCQEDERQLQQAESIVRSGGVVVYPTETLFALGGDPFQAQAADRILALKQRKPGKPLPLIIGGMDQLSLVTSWEGPEILHLAASFWPGPLSVLVPAKEGLAGSVQDGAGWASVRWTPHPAAQELSLRSARPLIATSANLSEQRAVSRSQDLDPALASKADLVLDLGPPTAGGPPSTLVKIVQGKSGLVVLRQGAIPVSSLQAAGYRIFEQAAEE